MQNFKHRNPEGHFLTMIIIWNNFGFIKTQDNYISKLNCSLVITLFGSYKPTVEENLPLLEFMVASSAVIQTVN